MDTLSFFERDGADQLNLPPSLRQKYHYLVRPQTSAMFFARVGRVFAPGGEEFRLVQRAYEDAAQAYAGMVRDSNGEPYVEHALAVATLKIERGGVMSPTQLVCRLLHDAIEDGPGWDWRRVADLYGVEAANLIQQVSKPGMLPGWTKEDVEYVAFEILKDAAYEAVELKILDDLFHNMVTLFNQDAERMRRKAWLGRHGYIPLGEARGLPRDALDDLDAVLRVVEQRYGITY